MDDLVVRAILAAAIGSFVTALVVATWLVYRGARTEAGAEAAEAGPAPKPDAGGDDAERAWSDTPDAEFALTWQVGESGAQGYAIVHRRDGRQVPAKQLTRESGGVVSDVIGTAPFEEAFQADALEPGSPLKLRLLPETEAHPASVGLWTVGEEKQVGYLSPDAAEWVRQQSDELFCVSLWEHWRESERTRLRVLLLKGDASFQLPTGVTPARSDL